MSPIRGTLYIIAQLVGAWIGLLIVTQFYTAGGDAAQEMPKMIAPLWGEGEIFGLIAMVELIGAMILGFCFARALLYKRSVFTFGAVVSGGVFLAILIAVVLTGNYLGIQGNSFALNPAIAIMYQALPVGGVDVSFGELLGQIGIALSAYAIIPMIGGTIGFYLSDFASKLSGQKVE
jgi:hypothetical protein